MAAKNDHTIKWLMPVSNWQWPHLTEAWQYRSLCLQLALKDFRIRYQQSLLGPAWAVLNPLLSTLILIVVFQRMAGVTIEGVKPYAFSFSGMVVWTFYASIIPEALNGMLAASPLFRKIYFPKLILPVSKMLNASIETGVSFLLFLMACIWWHQDLQWTVIIHLPLFVVMALLTGLGLALWASVLVALSRDFVHGIPHLIRLGIFVCPIAYPVSLVPAHWQIIYFLNPVSGLIEYFRWICFPLYDFVPYIWISLTVAFVITISGLLVFTKIEGRLNDQM